MSGDFQQKILYDVGYIKAKVEDLVKHNEEQNGKLNELAKKVNKHEVVIGKFGLAFSAVAFVMVTIFNFVVEGIRNFFYE